jgi:FtsP/CotA-like multicopper oxidase with cupredoxin domain
LSTDGIKRVTLTASIVEQKLLEAEGKTVVAKAYGFNGSSPGPTLVFTEGDKVAITIVNNLPEPTSIHWHGVIVPNSQDGVPDIGQPTPKIMPGESYTYSYTVLQAGTHMYHAHTGTAKQDMLGAAGGLIFLPKLESGPKIDRDFIYFLHEWKLPQNLTPEQIKDMPQTGSPVDTVNSVDAMPDWTSNMLNFFTMNGKAFPSTTNLNVTLGQRIRIRFYNIGLNTHPMHLHGQDFMHVEQDGNRLENPMQLNTLPVAPGQTQAIEILLSNPGIWPLHCQIAHHAANNLSSGFGGMAVRIVISPPLNISRSDSKVSLSWSSPFNTFTLQKSSDLKTWGLETTDGTEENGDISVSEPVQEPAEFFRLIQKLPNQ